MPYSKEDKGIVDIHKGESILTARATSEYTKQIAAIERSVDKSHIDMSSKYRDYYDNDDDYTFVAYLVFFIAVFAAAALIGSTI